MRISRLLGKTLREVPADADTISHQYLLRAAMVSQLTAGVYSFLPLGQRVLTKIENIIRDESNRAGGQEVILPVIHPGRTVAEVRPHRQHGGCFFPLKRPPGP